MGRMIDLARASRPGDRTSASMMRDKVFTKDVRESLRHQWRGAAHKSSQVHLHLFNESEGVEFYVTGWDGGDTIAALTNDGFRNVSLNEARGCVVDKTWDRKTPLWAVMEDHTYASDKTASVTRARYDPFDRMFSQYLAVSGTGDVPERNRKLVGESKKFALNESRIKPKWIVSTNHRNEWFAARRNRDLPAGSLPVEVVRAMDESEAVQRGRELHESGTAKFSAMAANYNPYFRNASVMSLDMDRVMAQALSEGVDGWKRRVIKVANKHKSRIGQWHARAVKLAKDGEIDDAVDVLVGAFGMGALPGDVKKMLSDWERSSD